MLEKPAKTGIPIDTLLARRWSPRAFESKRPVTREQIIALLEAARWAPSCYNDQPWRFIVWDRNTDEKSWERAFDCLIAENRVWVRNAPVLIAAVAGSRFQFNNRPNRWTKYDTGAAVENLVLEAVSLGLAAHEMGGFDAARLKEEFGIPGEYTPMAMIAVGYQGQPDTLEGELRTQELADRERRPLEEHFFEAKWLEPVKSPKDKARRSTRGG